LAAYSLLLVATPFLLLRAYLQTAIGSLSRLSLPVAGHEVLLVPLLAVLLVAALAWWGRRLLRPRSAFVVLWVLLLWGFGHQVADFYFGHWRTDLQHNWHTLAYLLFALLYWRYHVHCGRPPERAALPGLLLALLVSAGDETIQVFISSRIFDVGDIGKDAWGAAIGLSAVTLHESWPALWAEGPALWRPRWRDYRSAALPQLVLTLAAAGLLLVVGSLLTDSRSLPWVLLCWSGGLGLGMLAIHAWGRRPWRMALLGLLLLGAAAQSYGLVTQSRGRIAACGFGWVVYSGIPIPGFDVLIRPSGVFRLVDKKHHFNARDQQTLLRMPGDILLIGSGMQGRGGLGFPEAFPVQFLPDPELQRAVQVIVLPTREACAVYNRLREEGRRVTFVLHTTC
jgi:hypothetical protein